MGIIRSGLEGIPEHISGVNVLAECQKARLWAKNNPSKRKTPKGMPRFLQGWMERCQNAGGRNGQPSGTNGHAPEPIQYAN